MKENPNWLKSKGYIHLTPQINVDKRRNEIVRKVSDDNFISRYAFYPLIHASIDERRYKKVENYSKKRAHSFTTLEGKHKRNIKSRPLHYATHFDALIFGYYAEKLQDRYEEEIKKHPGLHESIIAYRKIQIKDENTNKSTIHFAHEIFEEIKRRATEHNECAVLAFDIKSFFSSLDHKILKKAWADLFQFSKLPNSHYNVFKAATRFSYILKEDLRIYQNNKGNKGGFNEKELAEIRNKFGVQALFQSAKVFREKINDGSLKIYKYPFRNEKKEPTGIPQGLPISAILANLYLLDFDLKILNLVTKLQCFYKRYSDDIAIVCRIDQMEEIERSVMEYIAESKLEISKEKTEKFVFKKIQLGKKNPRLTSVKISEKMDKIGIPFIYLGFEFNGTKALIKSANIAKFYRKMISSVKRKAKRAIKISKTPPYADAVIFRRQLYKLYTSRPLHKAKIHSRWKKIKKDEVGEYRLETGEKAKKLRSNYLTYVNRASEIMCEPAIKKQIRKHKKIFNDAIYRHLTKKIDKNIN